MKEQRRVYEALSKIYSEGKEELSSEKVELRRVDIQAEDAIGEAISIGQKSISRLKKEIADIQKAIAKCREAISITSKYIPMAEGLGDKAMTKRLQNSQKDAKDYIKTFEKIENQIKAI